MKKKIFGLLFVLSTLFLSVFASNNDVSYATQNSGITTTAKSAYVMDYDSNTVISSYNENKRLPIASMTKIMTCLLTFENIDKGTISYDTKVTISENASGMGGSQVFLDTNAVHTVDNLLKCVIIASANDCSVALAETISGNESSFVQLMNNRAKELGLTNTNFTNCTGLPSVNSYSSAKDVSIMLKELLKHKKYFEYSNIWLEDFKHPDGRTTTITNTNKLIKFYKGCDGGKTGFTSEALFCLSATAKRGDMRIISTVIGEENSKKRFKDISDMFNFAFNAYENKIVCKSGEPLDNQINVVKGKQNMLKITPTSNIAIFTKKGQNKNYDVIYELKDNIKAPIKKGDIVGTAKVCIDGKIVNTISLCAYEDIDKASFLDSIKKVSQNW